MFTARFKDRSDDWERIIADVEGTVARVAGEGDDDSPLAARLLGIGRLGEL